MGENTELLVHDPDAIAEKVAENLGKLLRRDGTDSELVYSPTARHSYFRDLLAVRGYGRGHAGAGSRLDRHAEQMGQVAQLREERAHRALRAGSIEYRVEPNRTDGTGGYFSPPLWLNQLFATANRPKRVLAGLIPKFPLPSEPGVSQINIPLLSAGTSDASEIDDMGAPEQDFTDSSASSAVDSFVGVADVALQLLELSPAGAHLDWAVFMDLSESYDANLEVALLNGQGATAEQILGVLNIPAINTVPYTDASPTGSKIDPFLGKAAAQIGDNRNLPPECWLMRTARWAWFQSSEDSGTRPFGLETRFYLGNDDNTPDPIGGLMGWPVFLDDAIPANLNATVANGAITGYTGGTQDVVICLRPRDMILLESDPQTEIANEPLSASMGVRLRLRGYAASLTGRRPAGISVVGGTGLAVQSGF